MLLGVSSAPKQFLAMRVWTYASISGKFTLAERTMADTRNADPTGERPHRHLPASTGSKLLAAYLLITSSFGREG